MIKNLKFHKIPKDEDVKKQWIHKIRRDEGKHFKVTKMTVVCSKHFQREDYGTWTPVRKYLKPGTVPSVFDWSKTKPERRPPKRRYTETQSDHSPAMLSDPVPGTSMETETFTALPLDIYECQVKKLKLELQQEKEKTAELERVNIVFEEENIALKEDNYTSLKNQLTIEKFAVERFSTNNTLILFYTCFLSYLSFLTFFTIVQPNANIMQSAYDQSSETISLRGRPRNMLLIDEILMFFCRLRAGLLEQDLSVRFNCSLPTVSRKIITWANFLYFTLVSVPIWLPKETIQDLLPEVFKSLYPRTRVVIDCTELKTEALSSLVLNSMAYSTYKSSPTVKCLLGIAPHGMVTFVSNLFTGTMSDVEITQLSGLLDLLEPGDDVMADKGFTVKKLLEKHNVTLNIPNFLSHKKQFSVDEIENAEQIANLRIHIERMNRRIKENHLFDAPIPMSLCDTVPQLWTVACLVANYKGPLVKAWSQ